MPTMCRLVTLLTLASAVSRSVAYEEPDCPLQNVVHFAESSDFDPNLPLTFGGGIVLEMTLTTPSTYSYGARVFSFSNYGQDVVSMSTGRSGSLVFSVSKGNGTWSALKAANAYNGKTFAVRVVILPGSTSGSTKGKCFLYINGDLSSSGDCTLPIFVERRANFIGYDLDDSNPTFEGTVSKFTLKACKVTASVPTPLPSPQCVLQTVVHFAESSDFDPNLPLTFGGGIVIEMTLTTPSTYSYGARLFSFSNYGEDVVRMNVMAGGAIFFGTSRGFGRVSGGRSRPGFNGKTFTVRAVILPGSTSDSTTGQCLLYVNGILIAYGVCPIPIFVERRENFIGYDLDDSNPTFQGTVASFTLKACKVTPSVPTPLPSPQCVLQNVVDFANSSDFDPNLPLTFGGGIVIEVTLTAPTRRRRMKVAVFSFSNYGQDVVRMSAEPSGHLLFGVSRGSGSWSRLKTSRAQNGKMFTVRVVILPGSTADSTTGQCLLYVNGILNAYGDCPAPTFVERRANFIGYDESLAYANFDGTVSNFTLKACNVTPSVPTPLPSPQCVLQNVVHFAERSDFDPNLPLTFGGGIVLEMNLTIPWFSSYGETVFSFSNYGQDVVTMYTRSDGQVHFAVSRGSGTLWGIGSSTTYRGETFTVRVVILPGSSAHSTKGKCFLYLKGILSSFGDCPIPTFVERRANFIGYDLEPRHRSFKGTVANFTLKACKVTPSVPTPLPSPRCVLQNDVHFANSSDFDPNLPLTFGGGIVIEMNLTTTNSPTRRKKKSTVFSSSNNGQDVVRMSVELGKIYFGVSRGSGDVKGITARNGYPGYTYPVHAVILPRSTGDSTTGHCLLYINNMLQAYSICQIPRWVERTTNIVGNDTSQSTIAHFSMRSCNESLYTSAPATAVPDTALPDTLAPDTAAPPPRTAHPVPPGDSAAPMVPTAGPKGVVTAPTDVSTVLHTVVPTPLRTSAPTALNNATAFDETDAPTTAAPEKDDSGTPGWVWVTVGLGAVVVLVVGGVLVWFFRHGNAMSRCTFDEFIQAQEDLGVSELLNSGVEDPSTVHL